ncbi:MAG: DUF2797 domain-containing protein [Bacteroidetes bacterium]|nr:DUF2797 domain-containing protein [Bacteroidota bacterium]
MEITGIIRKMEVSHNEVVEYKLPLGLQKISMNELIGSSITMTYLGTITCIRCGRETRKSFAQGFCYPCLTTAPETEECVLRPELCRAHEGVARDMDYARKHCLTEQVVYLSLTSGLKVGVTRSAQVPVRWMDQGAIKAVELARTPNRFTAGAIELALKTHMSDKTNWRKMLTGPGPVETDLPEEKQRIVQLVPESLRPHVTTNNRVFEFVYPVTQYPQKISSLNFEKESEITGVLSGIKGQYLLFEGNRVINMRKFGGYLVRFRAG